MTLSVCVVGTIFLDCKGFSRQKFDPSGRNLGNVSFIHGGVGRNVAENLANQRLPVTFVSSVDDTAIGKDVVNRLNTSGVNTSYLVETEKNGMGIWLAIIDESGDLAGSISMMPDLALLEKLILTRGDQFIEESSHLLLELDLNIKITRRVIELSRKMGKPVYGIPGNLDVIVNNPDILQHLECFICNEFEAGRIMGVDLAGMDLDQKIVRLAEYSPVKNSVLRYMVVTMGSEGSIYCDSYNQIVGHQPAIPATVVDTTGAGDAFFSGTAIGLIQNLPVEQAVLYGTRMASWTIQSSENVCMNLPDEMSSPG